MTTISRFLDALWFWLCAGFGIPPIAFTSEDDGGVSHGART
jgi:hypothetical protein